MRRAVVAMALLTTTATGCGSPSAGPVAHVDPALDLLTTTARLEFDQGNPTAAAASYAQALDRAREMDDPAAVASAAYELAVARAASADTAGALAALDESLYAAAKAGTDPTDASLVRGRVELFNGNPAAAALAADAALGSATTAAQRAQAHVIKGLAACRSGDAATAAAELAQTRGQTTGADAMLAGLQGEVSLLSHDNAAAAAAFDQQADMSRKAQDFRTMRRALAKAGRAYTAAGRVDLAADRLYRAARAAVGAGDRDAAQLATAAAAAARSAGDRSLVRLADLLCAAAAPATQPASSRPASN
jgi:hypothetical protein